MYTYETLVNTDLQTLYQVFTKAFSDYQADLGLSMESFHSMMIRRGFDPELSVGAFKEPGHELVGFVLNGVRDWNGKLTAYDLGTGVIPTERRRGITREILGYVMDRFRQNNIEQYLLEVLQENKGAFELYKQQGFQITRSFSVFNLDKIAFSLNCPSGEIEYITDIKPEQWQLYKAFWDFNPSWQNSIDSVRSVKDEFIFAQIWADNMIAGYGIVNRTTGDIPQIAVHKQHRRKGIGINIIAGLMERTMAGRLRIINVDDDCTEMVSFLKRTGFELTVRQYEMILPII